MAREGSLWSRTWGGIAVLAFAVHLGAAVYEAVVVAPLWSLSPPSSVSAWIATSPRPDSSLLFHPLVAVIAVATAMAWMSGLLERGGRRWWLTLSLACAGGLAFVTVSGIVPVENALFTAGGPKVDEAPLVALTGEWIRASAMRLAALVVGAWAAYRAQLSPAVSMVRASAAASASDRRRTRDFAFGDEGEDEITLGEEAPGPRERWRSSLPTRRRTAKK